jgi:hypothetical protein
MREVGQPDRPGEERHGDLPPVCVAAEYEMDASRGGLVETRRIVRKQDRSHSRRAVAQRAGQVVAPRPGVVDRGKPDFCAAVFDDHALVSQDPCTVGTQARDERLALAEIIVIAHRHVDAEPGAQGADHPGHVFVILGSARHQIARHDGQVRSAPVRGARPSESPCPGRQGPHVQVGELRDAQPVEARVEPGNVHLPLDDLKPTTPDENAVAAHHEPRKVAAGVPPHRQMHGRSARDVDHGNNDRREHRRDECPHRRAPMNEIGNIDEADERRVSAAVRQARARPPDEQCRPEQAPSDAHGPRHRRVESARDLDDRQRDGHVRRERCQEDNLQESGHTRARTGDMLRRVDALVSGRCGHPQRFLRSWPRRRKSRARHAARPTERPRRKRDRVRCSFAASPRSFGEEGAPAPSLPRPRRSHRCPATAGLASFAQPRAGPGA